MIKDPSIGKKTQFQKGQSGNPGGRPRDLEGIKDLCRQHAPDAIAAAVKILKNPKSKPGDILKAGEMILDRAYGKPVQEIKGALKGSVYAEVWNQAVKRCADIDAAGRVRVRAKKKIKPEPGGVSTHGPAE
jgi:hypothetical protein